MFALGLNESWNLGFDAKYCPFIDSLELHKPAADCELELNNQSAVVSIVMLSPIGRKNGIGHMTIRTDTGRGLSLEKWKKTTYDYII